MKNIIIGIDISSKTLDICLKNGSQIEYDKIDNTQKSIRTFFKAFKGMQVIVAMENTGRYNWELYSALPKFNFTVFVIIC